jgi:hypothetical protein
LRYTVPGDFPETRIGWFSYDDLELVTEPADPAPGIA